MKDNALVDTKTLAKSWNEVSTAMVDNYVASQNSSLGLKGLRGLSQSRLANERTRWWGTIFPMSIAEKEVHNQVRKGFGINTVESHPRLRPYYVIGKWSLKGVMVTCFVLAPAVVTSVSSTEVLRKDEVKAAQLKLDRVWPSTTGSDNIKVESRARRTSVKGRLCVSLMSVCESLRANGRSLFVMHLSNLGFTSLSFIVSSHNKKLLAQPSASSIEIMKRDTPNDMFVELGVDYINIYGQVTSQAHPSNSSSYIEGSSTTGNFGNVVIRCSGTLTYNGSPNLISASFGNLRRLLWRTMSDDFLSRELVESLEVKWEF